jgi:hypothetical protein
MAVRRGRLGRFLDTGDDVGSVDGLWLLRILITVEFKKNPMQQSASVSSIRSLSLRTLNILFGAIGVHFERAA